jgi:hypothetical protein
MLHSSSAIGFSEETIVLGFVKKAFQALVHATACGKLPVPDHRGPGSVANHSSPYAICCKHCGTGTGFSPGIVVNPVSIIPSLLYTYILFTYH